MAGLRRSPRRAPLDHEFQHAARDLVGNGKYGIQVGVAVPFREPDSEGMPNADELAQLIAFEGEVSRLSEASAIFVGVITTGGMREFVLYAGSGDWIEAFHRDLEAALPSHDVQVMAKTDPDWAVYRHFVPE